MEDRLKNNVTATLRPYQLDAVTWALQRENALESDKFLHEQVLQRATENYLEYLFEDDNGKEMSLSVLECKVTSLTSSSSSSSSSSISSSSSTSQNTTPKTTMTLGGILGDEMGIGKTLEIQTLVLLHPQPRKEKKQKHIVGTKGEKEIPIKVGSSVYWIDYAIDDNTETVREETKYGVVLSVKNGTAEIRVHLFRVNQNRRGNTDYVFKGKSNYILTKPLKDIYVDNLYRRRNMCCVCDNASYDHSSPKDIVQCLECGLFFHSTCSGGKKLFVNGNHKCLHCLSSANKKLECGATLIVCPMAILGQWKRELSKHSRKGSCKVLIYKGIKHLSNMIRSNRKPNKRRKIVKRKRKENDEQPDENNSDDENNSGDENNTDDETCASVHPSYFDRFDVVLTTYSILRGEIHHAGLNLKKNGRFITIPTPLMSVTWWRLALDEAQ
jgi:SNF2 family DNA or RNA helicase